MNPKRNDQPNYAMLAAIVFSLFCWLGLFAVWSDLGEAGFSLLRAPGMFSAVEGAILVALNGFGLVVLAVFASACVAALVRVAHDDAHHGRPIARRPR